MRVTLLYFDGCPHWRTADEHLRAALDQSRIAAELDHRRVETIEDAERLRFAGSPTVLIEGVDPFSDSAGSFGLSCRLYSTPNGLSGVPTIEQIRAALDDALRRAGN
jgi:hypothetical protein